MSCHFILVHMPVDRLQACAQAVVLLGASAVIKNKAEAKKYGVGDDAAVMMCVRGSTLTRWYVLCVY